MVRISIIGSSGRLDYSLWTIKLYDNCFLHSEKILLDIIKHNNILFDNIELVSGGSSFVDHIAVLLYMKYKHKGIKLFLYIPCNYSIELNKYINCKCATTLNNYHSNFSSKINRNSFLDLSYIKKTDNAKIITYGTSFLGRNIKVGECDYLLAYTFTKTDIPGSRGTLHTWNNSKCKNKIHYNLYSLKYV